MIGRSVFILCLVMVLAAIPIASTSACSGYPYFSLEDLPKMDMLVRATVLETDDRLFNAILRVEDYYSGSGPRFVMVMRYPSALASGSWVRGYDTSCLYAGRGHYWRVGSQGYFGLKSNGDGTFSDDYGGTAHFYPVNGVITYDAGATEGYAMEFNDPLAISETDFVKQLLDAGGRKEPIPPSTDIQFYPLKRFLNVTTEDGSRYQINPDRSITPLPEDGPLAISPDGAHVAFREDEQTIAFQYIWTNYWYTDEARANYPADSDPFEQFMVEGEAVRFSNDSNFAAVWNRSQMTIVMLTNQSPEYSGYGTGLYLHIVATVDLQTSMDAPLPTVLWSADSSTVVWQDERGIWGWNLVEAAEAAQILTAADLQEFDWEAPALLDVSAHGRFVRFGEQAEWILVDSTSGARYANTVAAPTEQYLIVIGEEEDTTHAVASLEECKPPLRSNCVTQLNRANGVQWTYPYHLDFVGTIGCRSAEGCYISMSPWHPSLGGDLGWMYPGALIADFRQITYDPFYDQFAMLVGDYQVFFDLFSSSYLDEVDYEPYLNYVDLQDEIESPITAIEWGQSIFYDQFMLTTNAWIPR